MDTIQVEVFSEKMSEIEKHYSTHEGHTRIEDSENVVHEVAIVTYPYIVIAYSKSKHHLFQNPYSNQSNHNHQ